jgi:hypothetical protein
LIAQIATRRAQRTFPGPGESRRRIAAILITTGDTGPCDTQPDCRVWLESGCDRRLTRRNPAVYTSIEPVANLADGETVRSLTITSPVGTGWIFAGVVVQFWTKDCGQLFGSDWTSTESPAISTRGQFVIPTGAKWMTVAGGQGFAISWSLR